MNLYIVCHLLILLGQCLCGGDDHHCWTKVSIEKKIPCSLKLELSQGLRLKDRLSTFNQTFFEVSLSYKNLNGLRINIPYRYTVYEDIIKHRLSFGASYQYNFKPVSLKYRIKYYRLYENGKPFGEDEEAFGNMIRSKCTIKYKSGAHVKPYISGELFHLLNTENIPLNEFRASFGFEIDLRRKNSMYIFYILKKEELSKSNLDNVNVFGLSYISKI